VDTLFKRYNLASLLIMAVVLRLVFSEMSWYSYVALIISLHQFFLLFNSIGEVIPVRYLFGSFMSLQILLGPVFAYNGLDVYQYYLYKMQVPEGTYFSYAIPAVALFILGLHINARKLSGETVNVDRVSAFGTENKNLPYIFIAVGFVSSLVSNFFSSELAFVFYLLGGFKFVGAFLLILGNQKLKIVPLILVFGSIISSSLGSAMFHDLLTWAIFIGAVFSIKYKPTTAVKMSLSVGFILLSVFIQQVKGIYRKATWMEGKEGGLSTLVQAYSSNKNNSSLFTFEGLAGSNVRINQGFIITYIMNTVPNREPFSKGAELSQILEAAFLPRFLAPNKLEAGDRQIFMRYTGLTIREGTSMGLSSVGDAYINFGIFGGCIIMFILGLLYSEVLNGFGRYAAVYPILILFVPLVFYFPIRPDSEFQTLLGHLVKSCILIFVIFRVWKGVFKENLRISSKGLLVKAVQ
jgi:hypothetical protein